MSADEYVLVPRKDLERWQEKMDDALGYVNHPAMSPSLHGECEAAVSEICAVLALPAGVTQAALDVMAERQRQISAEGYSPEHDDEHVHGELAAAAASYALVWPSGELPFTWPWAPEFWKPRDELGNLARAGALIQAEMERLYRAKAKAQAIEEAQP